MDQIKLMQMRRHNIVICNECYSTKAVFDDEKTDYRCGECGSFV